MEKGPAEALPSIGGFVPETPFFLAPMAGFTDYAYRNICGEMGASLLYTEMVSAKGLCYNDRRSMELLELTEGKPTAFQLFGSEPDFLARAAEKLDSKGNVILDINMGCPVPKIVKNGEGSALLRDPERIYRIMRALKDATDKPLTAKIRIGIQDAPEDAYLSAAQAIEEGGGAAVAVHGRTREMYYSGACDRSAIRRVAETVSIPVIGNGDIRSYEDAVSMMEETGCAFVMVGRGALGNPWIFRELDCRYRGEPFEPPTAEEKRAMMVRHYRAMEADKGEYTAVREMRKFTPRYLKGSAGSAALRGKINDIKTGDAFCRLIETESFR